MLISVVIPVYNIESYIEPCIESVLIQDYKELEIILVDDGSTDTSGNICDNYAKTDNRIKVFHIENSGLSGARNYGTKAATGEFVYYLDGDDCFADEFAISSSAAKISDDVDAVIAKYAVYDNTTGSITPEPFSLKDEYVANKSGENGFATLLNNIDRPIWCAWRTLFRRSLMVDNDIWFRLGQLNEDLDMMPHLYRKARRLAVNDRVNTLYRVNRDGSIMTTVSASRFIGVFQIITRWLEFLETDTTCSDDFRKSMLRQMEITFFSYVRKFKSIDKKEIASVISAAKPLSFLLNSRYVRPSYRKIYKLVGFKAMVYIMLISGR